MKSTVPQSQIESALRAIRRDFGKKSKTAIVLTITTHPSTEKARLLPLRHFEEYVCLPIAIRQGSTGLEIIEEFDGRVDAFFVDVENKLKGCRNLFSKIKGRNIKSDLFPVKGNDFTADASFATIHTLLGDVAGKKICIMGAGNIGAKLALKLVESGADVHVLNSTAGSSGRVAESINVLKPVDCQDEARPATRGSLCKGLDCIVGFTRGSPVIDAKIVGHMGRGGVVIDGGTGTISPSGLKKAREMGVRALRIDIRAGFAAGASLSVNTKELLGKACGTREVKNCRIVSGGYIGESGDVIVDDISRPRRIVGIADGRGGVRDAGADELRRIRRVLKL